MNTRTIQDDQNYDHSGSLVRGQRIRIEERWESLKPDGSVWTWEATRDDLIFKHLKSNAHFADHQEWLRENNHPKADLDADLVPLSRIRKVTRYEVSSTWEVASDVEDLDEMTEQLNLQPCAHPADRRDPGTMNCRPFCGRCGERVP